MSARRTAFYSIAVMGFAAWYLSGIAAKITAQHRGPRAESLRLGSLTGTGCVTDSDNDWVDCQPDSGLPPSGTCPGTNCAANGPANAPWQCKGSPPPTGASVTQDGYSSACEEVQPGDDGYDNCAEDGMYCNYYYSCGCLQNPGGFKIPTCDQDVENDLQPEVYNRYPSGDSGPCGEG